MVLTSSKFQLTKLNLCNQFQTLLFHYHKYSYFYFFHLAFILQTVLGDALRARSAKTHAITCKILERSATGLGRFCLDLAKDVDDLRELLISLRRFPRS